MQCLSKRQYWFAVVLISIGLSFSRFGMFCRDYYYMIAHAEDMISNGLYRNVDIFTVHDGFYFLYQKWAMCLLVYCMYQLGGFLLLDIMASFTLCCLFVFVFYLTDRFNPDYRIVNLVIGTVCPVVYVFVQSFRPHVLIGFVLLYEVYVLEEFMNDRQKSYNGLIISLFICSLFTMWFHSTMWIVCVLVVLPYLFDSRIDHYIFAVKRVVVTYGLIFMILASFLQPNGIEQYRYMWVCMTAAGNWYKDVVAELHSLTYHDIGFYYVIGSLILMFYVYSRNRRNNWSHVLLLLGFAFLALNSERMLFDYFLLYPVLFGLGFAKADIIQVRRYQLDRINTVFTVFVCMLFTCLFLAFDQFLIVPLEAEQDGYAREVVDEITAHKDVRVWNWDSAVGSYIIMKGMKPYIDCRLEVYDDNLNHSKNVVQEYADFIIGLHEADPDKVFLDLQDEYKFNYYIVTKAFGMDVLVNELDEHGIKLFENNRYILYSL